MASRQPTNFIKSLEKDEEGQNFILDEKDTAALFDKFSIANKETHKVVHHKLSKRTSGSSSKLSKQFTESNFATKTRN